MDMLLELVRTGTWHVSTGHLINGSLSLSGNDLEKVYPWRQRFSWRRFYPPNTCGTTQSDTRRNDLEKVYPWRQRFSWRRFYPPNTCGTTQSDTRRNDLEKVYPWRQRFSWRRFYPPNTCGTTQSDTRRSVRQTTYMGSRLAVDDLPGSRLVNAENLDDLHFSRLRNDLEKVYPWRQRFSWRRFYPPNTCGTTQSDTRRQKLLVPCLCVSEYTV
ncbi:hypothetical protein DY000_02043694 [Brassica cretica]|uniref:Uncharacterized protein n=1 Tax=Brassica cretica TaxID=69181 RepID=A0ABQ7BIE8_BRACR|nr:hypothetical protein DY000_02043694 [Brassica cretica]